MVSLAEKIEEIRNKPQHIREKYVWGCVAASMVLIVTIWLFSIAAMFKQDAPQTGSDSMDNLKSQLENVNKQAPSLKDLGQQVTEGSSEEITKEKQADEKTDLTYPLPTQTTETPQSAAYSNDN